MPCSSPTPVPGESARALLDQLDAIDERLYHLEHLCTFISDIAGASEIGAQANLIQAESLQVVFDWIANEAKQIRNIDLDQIRKAVPRA